MLLSVNRPCGPSRPDSNSAHYTFRESISFISEMCERYCFETEVANRQDRFCRKLAMMNSPLFIPFIDSISDQHWIFYCLCITCTFCIFCILYFLVSCCHFGEIKFIMRCITEKATLLNSRFVALLGELLLRLRPFIQSYSFISTTVDKTQICHRPRATIKWDGDKIEKKVTNRLQPVYWILAASKGWINVIISK